MAIGQKLIAVMETCRIMPKDAENPVQHYRYTTAAGMFAKINEAFAQQGLYTQVEMSLIDLRDVRTPSGDTEKHATVSAKITVVDSATGEGVTFTGIGSGQDAGDKSVMKANTAALKYAYIGGLCIAMSDDPEADAGTTCPPPQKSIPASNEIVGNCEKCGKAITSTVADYSLKKFNKMLCFNCQKTEKPFEAPF